jgi:hypothetical protein
MSSLTAFLPTSEPLPSSDCGKVPKITTFFDLSIWAGVNTLCSRFQLAKGLVQDASSLSSTLKLTASYLSSSSLSYTHSDLFGVPYEGGLRGHVLVDRLMRGSLKGLVLVFWWRVLCDWLCACYVLHADLGRHDWYMIDVGVWLFWGDHLVLWSGWLWVVASGCDASYSSVETTRQS